MFYAGVYVLSSCNTNDVNRSIIYNRSSIMERNCLDVQYAYSALRKVINYSNYGKEIE